MPQIPKENPARANSSKRVKVVTHGKKHPLWFPLPDNILPLDKDGQMQEWHPMTRVWWNSLETSPLNDLFITQNDWLYLLDCALTHHYYWKSGSPVRGAELRQRLQKFGFTPEDRAKMRLDINTIELDDLSDDDAIVNKGRLKAIKALKHKIQNET